MTQIEKLTRENRALEDDAKRSTIEIEALIDALSDMQYFYCVENCSSIHDDRCDLARRLVARK